MGNQAKTILIRSAMLCAAVEAAAVSQGATEKQIAYIRKLGGTIPEDLTIRTASILIAQLKKGNRYNA